MVNTPVNPISLPALLARSRDTDTTVRKLLYSSVLELAATDGADPFVLTVHQRELLVRNGLGDREKTVRAAAASLIGTWVDVVGNGPKPEEELVSRLEDVDLSKSEEKLPLTTEEKQQKIVKTLTAFLHMFDLDEVSTDAGEIMGGKVASDALKSVFDTRPDIFEDLFFGGESTPFLQRS